MLAHIRKMNDKVALKRSDSAALETDQKNKKKTKKVDQPTPPSCGDVTTLAVGY